ncbi:hypothetical protein CTA2_3445 [Colletotrichum tanaceti]|uniref:Secreted protein n=1 Tax=Colletotrichum tanaceti TaxID=1306861 RepID=A0A4U6XL59_9PEZI|nr:hypothetical protein CTA2_3440 [Colletotrichum tanaceti]KAJ0168621.1 hypothetical protein CTA2_3445 [Colletotrichum tanaceti]TKW56353.1 hypothetical protein CTA1_7221 [Colletotrichum tanaceti]
MKAPKNALLQGATLLAATVPGSSTSINGRADSSACKLPANQDTFLSSGFGYRLNCAPSTGTLNALVLFVDFPDQAATEASPQELYDRLVTPAAAWFNTSSYGRLSLNVTADTTRFYRMPKNVAAYNMVRPLQYQDHYRYVQDALAEWLAATDTPVPEVNGTDGPLTDVVYVIPTANATGVELSATLNAGAYTYGVNYIARKAVTMGSDMHGVWGYKELNHETGHTFCLPDMYPIPESYATQYTGNFDMMANIGASSPDYFAWNKWRLGWLSDDQVECVVPPAVVVGGGAPGTNGSTTSTSTTHRLSPLETVGGGVKAVVVKANERAALVAEVRSKHGNDAGGCVTGVLLYTVATDVASGGGPIRVLDTNLDWGASTCTSDILDNSPLNFDAGGVTSYTVADWGVTVTLVGQDGDDYTIRIDTA